MIYGVIGDIHSNYDALTAVVAELQKAQVDKILCIGDIVGYAAEPAKCIDLINELNCITIAGNHDYAVAGKLPVKNFNPSAKAAILWTEAQLSKSYKDLLGDLPLVKELDDITLVHSSLNRPEAFDYITNLIEAQSCIDKLKTPVCFYGHTHVPLAIFLNDCNNLYVDRGTVFDLSNADKVIVNVGSVGQPRDWDTLAACAIYDTAKKTVTIKRVKYDIESAAKKVYLAGLPSINALRLMERAMPFDKQ